MLHFLKYNLIGVLNTLITILVVGVFHQWLDFPILPCNFLGYVVGGVNSYLLNRIWNFKSQNDQKGEITRFLVIFGLSYMINLGVLVGTESLMEAHQNWFILSLLLNWIPALKISYIAHILANIVYVVVSFSLYKSWVFAKRSPPPL